jgi:hypothetical protein
MQSGKNCPVSNADGYNPGRIPSVSIATALNQDGGNQISTGATI